MKKAKAPSEDAVRREKMKVFEQQKPVPVPGPGGSRVIPAKQEARLYRPFLRRRCGI